MADLKISQLASANVVNKDDLLYLIQNETDYNLTIGKLFASITDPTLTGNITLGGEVQTLNTSGVVNITTSRTDLYGGTPADTNALANGSILPSSLFLYTDGVSATGKGFTFVEGTPVNKTIYVRHANNKIYLSSVQGTTYSYPPDDWVGSTGLRPFESKAEFIKGSTYTFDVSDATNSGNTIGLSTSFDGTNSMGTAYTPGVTVNGTPGTPGANIVFAVANVSVDPGGKAYLEVPQGTPGQIKIINLVHTDGGRFVLSSNLQNNVSVELRQSGDAAILLYTNTGWTLIGANPGLVTSFSGNADDIPASAKLYFTNARARAAITPADGTIIYDPVSGTIRANSLALSNISLANLSTTTNYVSEGSNNLYFTNARVYANVSPLLTAKANVVDLTTSNVVEGSQLYYTNARVASNVAQMSINVFADVDITGITANGTLIWNGSSFVAGTATASQSSNVAQTANVANTVLSISNFTTSNLSEGVNLYYTNARVYSNVAPLISGKANVTDLTTANVLETASGLYYTNARVASNVLELLPTLAGTGISIAANGQISSTTSIGTIAGLNTANVAESANNLYYTNARVYSNVSPLLAFKANITDLTTSNVAEGSQLYFTNTRSRLAISAGTGIGYDNITGVISIGQDVATTAAVTFANLNITGTTNFYGNVTTHASNNLSISDNMIYLNAGSEASNPDLGIAGNYNDGTYHHAGFFRDASDNGTWKAFENYSPEPDANIFIDTSHATFRLANIAATTFYGNLVGTVSSLGNFTTSSINEGSNLYYTNTRVYSNVAPLLAFKANIADLTTANIIETSSGLYYTNTRVYSNVAPLLSVKANIVDLTTANVVETASGLYYTNARVYSNVSPLLAFKANIVDLTTANVLETSSGLYYTNARVLSNVSQMSINVLADVDITGITANGTLIWNGTSFVAGTATSSQTSNVAQSSNVANTVLSIDNFTTSNLAEGVNLYYTNARVYSNVSPLLAFKANINDLTTANVLETSSGLYYTNARVHANVSPLLAVKANVSDLTTANVTETASGLYYTNARVLSNITAYLAANPQVSSYANANVAAYLATYNGNISATIWTGIYTANVIESADNLYYTNARVYSNVLPLISGKANVSDLTTANVTETASGLYYTNTRVYSNVAPLLAFKANITDLTTSNVVEGNNLYYTNSRVLSYVTPLIAAKANVGDLTTANVLETDSGLYYTNARVYSNVLPLISGKANVTDLTTSNVVEGNNLYYSNSRVYANIAPLLTTANIAEVGGTLYYTNARVRSAVSGGTGVSYDNTTGVIAIGQNVSPNATVTFGNLNITGVTNFYGNVITHSSNNLSISDNMIYLNAGSEASNPDLGIAGNYNDGTYHHTGFFRDASDGIWKVFDNYTPEPDANIFIDTSHPSFRLANLAATTFSGNLFGNVTGFVSSISNFTTSSLAEGNNLYYTNARVSSYVTPFLTVKANVTDLTTANVTETASGLYYTNTRVYSNVAPLLAFKANIADLTTANVVETASGLYYTNSRVISNINLMSINAFADVDTATLPKYVGYGLIWDGTNWVPNVITVSSTELQNVANTVLGIVQGSIIANVAVFAANANFANLATFANTAGVANSVVSISNFTTSNLAEGTNLYYTNTRVYSNVAPLLSLKANVTDLTTANVLETASGLYYTNARVYSNVSPLLAVKANIADLTTSNVVEGNQLYYTNARVASNVVNLLPAYTGNISAGNVITTVIYANSVIGSATGGYITGANLISTNIISATTWTGIYTANVLETAGNLYYTNARVYSNVAPLLSTKANVSDLTTANVTETASGLYYTNARVYSNVIGLINVKANIADLTTANVLETASGLYYTNARVYSNVIGLLNAKANVSDLTTSNVVEGNNLYYTNSRVASNVLALLPTLAGDNIVIAANGRISATASPTVYANAVIGLNTANVTESASNLYYTEQRANTAIDNRVTKTFVENLGIAVGTATFANTAGSANTALFAQTSNVANTVLSLTGLTTSNLSEGVNLYYTNTRVYSNVEPLLSLKANIVDLTTSNVVEGSQLYYTNSRARTAISAGTGVYYDATTGVVAIGQNVSPNATVTFGNLNITGVTNFYGNVITHASNNLSISDNMIYLNSGSEASNPDLGFAGNYNDGTYHHAGFFRDASDGTWKVFDNYAPEPDANIFINTEDASFRLANLAATTFTGNVVGNVTGFVSSISNFSTSNLSEGNNLYYTNARVYANVIGLLNAKANVRDLTTANVIETASGLYYTNARVYSNVIGLLNAKANVTDLTTSNVVEGNNLYYTNARVASNVTALLPVYAGNISAGNVTATTVYASTIVGTSTGGYITGANLITTNIISATTWTGIYTANVLETAGNLYYTNARVYSNVAPLLAFKANIVDLTTANVLETSSGLYYTNARVYSAISGNLATKANVSDLTTSNVAEGTNLYFTNTRVLANISQMSINAFADVDTVTLTKGLGYGLIWDGANWVPNVITVSATELANVANTVLGYVQGSIVANVAVFAANANFSNTANIANVVLSLSNFTTSNLAEGNNLYYTNSRVASNVINVLPTYTGNIAAGNLNTTGAVSYGNVTAGIKVYQVYNSATNSLDTIFV